MSIFTAEPVSEPRRYDVSSEVATAVTEATRHLCDFRAGLAEIIVRLAEEATQHLPGVGHGLIEPAVRALGAERATRYAGQLYRIASDVTGDPWPDGPDRDEAARTLRAVAERAAHDVADELERDTRICRAATEDATKEKHQ